MLGPLDIALDVVTLPGRPRHPELWVTSPVDQVLRKLDWYRLGQEASDRQWRDIIGLLQAQGPQLDVRELRADAGQVALGELLEQALEAAGTQP